MNLENARVIAARTSKTIYREDDKVIKVFNEDFSKADILNEALNIARVEETGIPMPHVQGVEMVEGKWAIVTDFIEGKTLARLMEEEPEKKQQYLERLVDIQMELHTKTAPMLSFLHEKMRRKISQTGLDATTRYELDARLDSLPKHRKLCHGDFNPSNVIIKPDGGYAVLDWSHATQGNASADAATTYLLFSLKDQKLAELYLDTFCEMSDTAKQYVQRWMPITAASRLNKKLPGERELLESWLDVVEYE